MLKSDLHLHCKEDPKDFNLKYSAKELIDLASKKGFEVLAITLHDELLYTKELVNYAKERNILLLPGCERTIEDRHVLLYNFSKEEIQQINSFEDLRKIKSSKHLVIAPHPFFPHGRSLYYQLYKNLDLFDAIEYAHFYTKHINFNYRAVQLAKRKNLPLVGNSDSHFLFQFNTTYSIIDSEKNIDGIIQAIKAGKVTVETKPLLIWTFLRIVFNCFSPVKI